VKVFGSVWRGGKGDDDDVNRRWRVGYIEKREGSSHTLENVVTAPQMSSFFISES
jgi:hypothetical protein